MAEHHPGPSCHSSPGHPDRTVLRRMNARQGVTEKWPREDILTVPWRRSVWIRTATRPWVGLAPKCPCITGSTLWAKSARPVNLSDLFRIAGESSEHPARLFPWADNFTGRPQRRRGEGGYPSALGRHGQLLGHQHWTRGPVMEQPEHKTETKTQAQSGQQPGYRPGWQTAETKGTAHESFSLTVQVATLRLPPTRGTVRRVKAI